MKKIILQIALVFQVALLAAAPNWEVNTSAYEFSMTITGTMSAESEIVLGENDMLAAFVGDDCRGVVEVVYEADYETYFFYLTVFSNEYEGEELSFQYYNAANDKVSSELVNVPFSNGGSVGSLTEPFDFSGIDTGTGAEVNEINDMFTVYPNPIVNELHFSLENNVASSVSIFNINGVLVKQTAVSENYITVTDLPNGTYLVQVESNNKKYTQRFIKE